MNLIYSKLGDALAIRILLFLCFISSEKTIGRAKGPSDLPDLRILRFLIRIAHLSLDLGWNVRKYLSSLDSWAGL